MSASAGGNALRTFRQVARVAVDGLFFQSTVLLRWVVYLGFLVALAGGEPSAEGEAVARVARAVDPRRRADTETLGA